MQHLAMTHSSPSRQLFYVRMNTHMLFNFLCASQVLVAFFFFLVAQFSIILFSSALSCIKLCLCAYMIQISPFFFHLKWNLCVYVCVRECDRGVRLIISVILIFKSSVYSGQRLYIPGCILRGWVNRLFFSSHNRIKTWIWMPFVQYQPAIQVQHKSKSKSPITTELFELFHDFMTILTS